MGFRVRAEDAFVESRCQTTHLLHTVSVCGGRNNVRWCPEICYTAVRFLRSDFNYDRRFVSTICMSAVGPQNSRSHNYVYASNTAKLDHECVTPLWPWSTAVGGAALPRLHDGRNDAPFNFGDTGIDLDNLREVTRCD
jgi:hypothetical protein